MAIELVHLPAEGGPSGPPVLFVPGAFTGAWLWRDTFLRYFAGRGLDTWGMSFGAHGRQGWRLHRRGLDVFVAELGDAVGRLPGPPVIIGHSLGGLVAYEYARGRDAAGLVLFSAVPPDGSLRSFLGLAREDPVSAAKFAGLALFPPLRLLGDAPQGVYSEAVDPEAARATTRRLRAESWRVLTDALARPREGVGPLATPVYVLGLSGDAVIPESEVRRTADLLGAPCRILEGYSHTPPVEPGWEAIAGDIADWIDGLPAP